MAARSTLTVAGSTTIASSWGNNVRDHAVTRTTSDDVSAEGQLCANTSTDRIVVHDGTSARTLVEYGGWATWTPGVVQGAGGVYVLTPGGLGLVPAATVRASWAVGAR
jgi:hypothetical protein